MMALRYNKNVAQIISPEYCFAPCFTALFTRLRLEIHSIRELVPSMTELKQRESFSGTFFFVERVPKNARRRDSQKVLPAHDNKETFGQHSAKIFQ